MTDLLNEKTFTRRRFVQGSGALVVGFSLAGAATAGRASAAQTRSEFTSPDVSQVDSWVVVHPDNTATIQIGKVELGQGSPTGLMQIAAEELDLGMDQIRTTRVDTSVTPDQGFTAGSSSISRGGPQVAAAAAEARQALLGLASAKLGVPASQLSVAKGIVSGGGKSVSYGDLIGGQLFNVKITGKAPQKKVSDYKVVGTRVPRLDIPAKINGKYTYMQNVRVPGMLHGRIVRPHGQGGYGTGAKPLSVDASSIKHIKGAQIVRKGDFLGVVAPQEFAAIQAAAELKVKWSKSPTMPGDGNVPSALRASQTKDSAAVNTGNVDSALAGAAKTVEASYTNAFQSHGMIGPSCAIADVQNGTATVLCSTQLPYSVRASVAKTLGFDTNAVRLQRYEGSGCYGHSCYDDAVHAAAVMSQAVGKPVRVQFMRWDEHGWDNYGPGMVIDVKAGIDGNGKLVGFDYTSWQQGWMSIETTQELIGVPVNDSTGNADTDNSAAQYAVANRRVTSKSVPNRQGNLPKVVWLRAPGAPQAVFATEQTIDDLAKAANMDPIAFRRLNSASDRWDAVMDAAATAAGWQTRPPASRVGSGRVLKGQGIAIGGFAKTYAAVIAQVEVDTKTGKISVKHLVGAQDAGLAVNPGLIENQIEGCLTQGCSRALLEEVKFSKTNVTSLDWASYPILRFKDAPKVTPIVVNRPDLPSSGSGEPTTAPVQAAIANAFFDATGKRIREYPMTPARVRAVLGA